MSRENAKDNKKRKAMYKVILINGGGEQGKWILR